MDWKEDGDIKNEIEDLVVRLELTYIDAKRIFCYRTKGSKARAYARIWSFPKIFQHALEVEPAYVIEVLSEKFDRLSKDKQKKVLIHELMHIPKNFSGSLLPHRKGFESRVEAMYRKLEPRKKRFFL